MGDERDFNVETVNTKSPAPIAHAVRGMDFPCSKDDLLEQARNNDAREEVLEQIEQMPDGEYQSMADVFAGVGEANRSEGRNGEGSEDDADSDNRRGREH